MHINNSSFPLSKISSAFIGTVMLFTSAGAIAGTVSGLPSTASADVVFNSPVQFINTLTAIDGLQAGNKTGKSISIAKGNVTFSAGATSTVALSFGEGSSNTNNYQVTTVVGASNPKNRLTIAMADAEGALIQGTKPAQDGIPSVFNIINVKNNVAGYHVNTFGAQLVQPDTYKVSVTAYAYTI